MQTVLIVIHLLIVVALVVVVLLQRSEGGALGMGGGGGFMTGRGQANVLTRATAILAALFFATSLGLTLLARYGHQNQLNFNVPAGPSEKAPTLPPKGQGSVLDQVRAIEQQRNGAGAAAPTTTPDSTPAASTAAPATPAASSNATPAQPAAAGPATPAEPSGMPERKNPQAPADASPTAAAPTPAEPPAAQPK